MSSAHEATESQQYKSLLALLEAGFPEFKPDSKDFQVTRFARSLDKSHETIYKALRTNRLREGVALDILRHSHKLHPESPLYWEDMLPFMLADWDLYRRGGSAEVDLDLGDEDDDIDLDLG